MEYYKRNKEKKKLKTKNLPRKQLRSNLMIISLISDLTYKVQNYKEISYEGPDLEKEEITDVELHK